MRNEEMGGVVSLRKGKIPSGMVKKTGNKQKKGRRRSKSVSSENSIKKTLGTGGVKMKT